MFKIEWFLENRVIFIEISGDVSVNETIQFNAGLIAWLDDSPPDTHILCDAREIKSYPAHLNELRALVTFPAHPHLGRTIMVTDNRLMRFIGELIYKVQGNSALKFIGSYEKAIDLLYYWDKSLPPREQGVD